MTLAISVAMALVMLGIAFGIIYMFEFDSSPIHPAFVLMIGAISFIMGSAFFNSRGAHQLKSLIGGGVIGTSSTFVIVSIVGGIRYAYAIYGTSDGPSWEMLVSMLAVCMVASMIILEFVLYRLRD
ncbi:MAG: hypothetical protein PHS47_03245 [Methanocellales archaeon]|nr:hypothetical protein [Methanocellales archaeon]MDD4898484.1 hypothetical protein [Methanocellales archaeon]MDD5447237.1 hypothetical protein [Methanocellales archaeon]